MDAEAAATGAGGRPRAFVQAVLHGTSISLGSLALAVVVDVLAETTRPLAFIFLLPPAGWLVGVATLRARTSGRGILVRLISLGICLYAGLVTLFLASCAFLL